MKKTVTILSIFFLSLTACKKDSGNPETPNVPANESEIITTVKLILTDSSGQQVTATWKDADGIGPQQPAVEPLNVKTHQTYSGRVLLLDETKIPADTISDEVIAEAEAHQFFYTLSGLAASNCNIQKHGVDANNLPVGIQFTLETTDTASGNLRVVLKHYDGIPKSTDPSIGETDVEVIFPLTIHP